MKIAPAFFCAFLAFAVCHVRAAAPEPATDLYKTLEAAANGHKMAFILMGRSTCGNCNATRAMIRDGKIPVTDADYVMGDINIDDPRSEAAFMRKYGSVKFGDTLPFVVVTDPHGKVLASSGGYKSEEQWTHLLAEAKSKATISTDAGGGSSDWPFKSPAH